MAKPAKRRLDLSALAPSAPLPTADSATGTGDPLNVALSDIQEDPDQPRREFDAEKLAELASSIRETGVRSPVSIRPHPTPESGFAWMLNYGARRYRASQAAGIETIPAFVDKSHGSYEQVIENLQRDDLAPLEIAEFIQRQITEAGDSKADIARKLGKVRSFVTEHLALIDMPDCIALVYSTDRCRSPLTLYTLRKLHAQYATEVEEWIASNEAITRATVRSLSDVLSSDSTSSEDGATKKQVSTESKLGHAGKDQELPGLTDKPEVQSNWNSDGKRQAQENRRFEITYINESNESSEILTLAVTAKDIYLALADAKTELKDGGQGGCEITAVVMLA